MRNKGKRHELNNIQTKLLELLGEVENICASNNIKYALAGGTTIGAIRHKGFLPWDDDLDIFMTRDNFNKFLKVYKEGKFPPNGILECPETDENYSNMFARYIRTDTTSVHSNQIAHSDPAGMVVDIFVLDPMNYTEEKYKNYCRHLMLYSDLLNIKMGFSTRYRVNKWRLPYYMILAKIFGKGKILRKLENKMNKLLDDKGDTFVMRWGGSPFRLERRIFDEYEYVDFEDIKVQNARNWVTYLTWQYGDEWPYLPPHSEREGHEAVMNTNLPYSVLRNDYNKIINTGSLRKAYLTRKIKHIFTNEIHYKKNDRTLDAQALKVKMEMENRSSKYPDIFEAFERQDYETVEAVLGVYIKAQLNADYIGRVDKISKVYRMINPYIINMELKYVELTAKLLMRTERMSKAYKLLKLYQDNGKVMTDVMNDILNEIAKVREAIRLYSRGEVEEAFELSKEIYSEYPLNNQNMRLMVRCILSDKRNLDNNKDLLTKLIGELDKIFPLSGEIAKYKGDMAKAEGDMAKARECYEFAKANTNNGMILLELEDV